MNPLATVMAAVAAISAGGLPFKEWKNELRRRNGRRPRADIKAFQSRWIARRHQDGVWRYDGRISAGEAA